MQCFSNVYGKFTQSLRPVYAKFTLWGYAEFLQRSSYACLRSSGTCGLLRKPCREVNGITQGLRRCTHIVRKPNKVYGALRRVYTGLRKLRGFMQKGSLLMVAQSRGAAASDLATRLKQAPSDSATWVTRVLPWQWTSLRVQCAVKQVCEQEMAWLMRLLRAYCAVTPSYSTYSDGIDQSWWLGGQGRVWQIVRARSFVAIYCRMHISRSWRASCLASC